MTNYQTDNIKLERWKPNSYTNDWSMSGVDCLRLDLENLLEREHVVMQVLEDGRTFPEDTVPAEDRVILLRNIFYNCLFKLLLYMIFSQILLLHLMDYAALKMSLFQIGDNTVKVALI